MGAGPVRSAAAERPGARRARRRGERGPARRAGVSRFRGGPHVFRAARGPGAPRRRAPQRRQPAPHPRGDPAAAGCWTRHGIRHRAGADAARLHAGVYTNARDPGRLVPVSDRRAGRPAARQAGRRARAGGGGAGAAGERDRGEPRLAHPAAAGRVGGRAAGRGGARLRRRGQGRLSAARDGRRERRLLSRRPRWPGRRRLAPIRRRADHLVARAQPRSRQGAGGCKPRPAGGSRGAVFADGTAGAAGGRDGLGPLPYGADAGRADPGRRRRERARRGVGAPQIRGRRGRFPCSAGRRAHPARRGGPAGPGPHRCGHVVCRTLQGTWRRAAGGNHPGALMALDFLFARGAYGDRAAAPPPRLVLLDLDLPVVDGLQVLSELRRHPRTSSLPVVLLTSSTWNTMSQRATDGESTASSRSPWSSRSSASWSDVSASTGSRSTSRHLRSERIFRCARRSPTGSCGRVR